MNTKAEETPEHLSLALALFITAGTAAGLRDIESLQTVVKCID